MPNKTCFLSYTKSERHAELAALTVYGSRDLFILKRHGLVRKEIPLPMKLAETQALKLSISQQHVRFPCISQAPSINPHKA